ncbi:MAG: uracil-DNA glycosylase family protein [Gammaproteobacteria bacterium]
MSDLPVPDHNGPRDPATPLARLAQEVRACRVCAAHLPLGPRPILRVDEGLRVLITGQAPGTRVHATGLPWNDPSGERLRDWLGVDRDRFYDLGRFGVMAMGFCYPGRGRGGDLPPRPECAPLWHARIRAQLPRLRLTLLIGRHAQIHYLGTRAETLETTVRRWADFSAAGWFPLPHPSPRNTRWLSQRPWFEAEVIPALRAAVAAALRDQ